MKYYSELSKVERYFPKVEGRKPSESTWFYRRKFIFFLPTSEKLLQVTKKYIKNIKKWYENNFAVSKYSNWIA